MSYTELINQANAQVTKLHSIFPGYTSQLLASVITAINDIHASPTQHKQLLALKEKLEDLPSEKIKSFIGSTAK